MFVKLFGATLLFACGAFYARGARERAEKELFEAERAHLLVLRIKNEIADYGVPLNEILKSFGVDGGVESFLSSLSCERIMDSLADLRLIGYGYGKEELRICDRLLESLEVLKKEMAVRLREVTAISRVKGYGLAAAAVIFFI